MPRPMRVLLVDDDPLILDTIAEVLSYDGHDVAVASDGQAALDCFSAALDTSSPFEVVVTDLGMPRVNGIQVANRIRAPMRGVIAGGLFAAAARRLGGDPRDTEPGRVIALVDPVPLLLIHGSADTTVPVEEGRQLAALAGPSAEHWVIDGARHSGGHAASPQDYERRVTDFLRMAFERAHRDDLGHGEGRL